MAAVEVDDGKPAVPEADPPVHVNAVVVRPAVAQRVSHRPDPRRAHRLGLNNPTDPAHSVSFIGRAGRSATAPAPSPAAAVPDASLLPTACVCRLPLGISGVYLGFRCPSGTWTAPPRP